MVDVKVFQGGSVSTKQVDAGAFGAKVLGLANLTRHWPLRDDTRILLCS